jgi:hypothetical protein
VFNEPWLITVSVMISRLFLLTGKQITVAAAAAAE